MRDAALEVEPGRPLIMGIVNAGPDSFSDPGRRGVADVVADGRSHLEAGAAIVDVGGESGRTDRPAVSEDEEIARVAPVVERLTGAGVTVSVDTWRAEVARAALAAGAAMVNDPSGLSDPAVAEACAEAGAALVVTHTRVPPKQKGFPEYDDVVADVVAFLRERVAEAAAHGVGEESIAIDPGLDLAKTPAESVDVLRRLPELGELGRPVLVAPSRKDFVGALTGRSPAERLGGTLAAVGAAATGGAAIVRVHDSAAVADYLRVRAALNGEADVAADLRLEPGLRREPGRAA